MKKTSVQADELGANFCFPNVLLTIYLLLFFLKIGRQTLCRKSTGSRIKRPEFLPRMQCMLGKSFSFSYLLPTCLIISDVCWRP